MQSRCKVEIVPRQFLDACIVQHESHIVRAPVIHTVRVATSRREHSIEFSSILLGQLQKYDRPFIDDGVDNEDNGDDSNDDGGDNDLSEARLGAMSMKS